MLIECSRCRAVFSLHESVAATGTRFKVQCGRCLAIFEAVATPRPSAPQPPPDDAPAQPPPPLVDPPEAMEDVEPEPAPSLTPEPAPPAPAPKPSPELLRLPRMQVRIVLAILALAIAAGVALYRSGLPRDAEEKIRQGRANLLLDDTRSLQEATKLFTDAARAAPGQAVPVAERAFALLLQASAQKDMANRVPAPEREQVSRAASGLLQQGAAAARQAIEDDREAPAALRAMALAEAISGVADQAAAHAEQAERAAPGDPWVLYAKAAAAAAGGMRDRAVQALSSARQAEPKLLRADVDLACIAIDGGDPAGARELLQRVLKGNPQHDRARRMLSLLPP